MCPREAAPPCTWPSCQQRRGLHRVPTLTAETRFPLGIFSRLGPFGGRPHKCWCIPSPEPFAPPLPAGEPRSGDATLAACPTPRGEYDGVRGLPPRRPTQAGGLEKGRQGRRTGQPRRRIHAAPMSCGWDRSHTGVADPEQQLFRLCAWVLAADKQGVDYGLRLGGVEIAPGCGEAHKKRCLEALALC
jgi:uncharacterized protein (DUF58 family)